MKISHRLVALAAFTSAGLLAGGRGRLFRGHLDPVRPARFDDASTPLQNKTYEMQERPSAVRTLLKLSLATDRAEVEKSVAAVDITAPARHAAGSDPRTRPKAGGDLSEFQVRTRADRGPPPTSGWPMMQPIAAKPKARSRR